MGLIDFYKKVKKGVAAGMYAIKKSDITTEELIQFKVKQFEESTARKEMLNGQKYYLGLNDIYDKKQIRQIQGGAIEETYRSNMRVAHNKYKTIVDEKINYLMAEGYSLECEKDEYLEEIKRLLGSDFDYTLTRLGFEASNKGIAWLQVYLSEEGLLEMEVIPAEFCIPLWKDGTHKELQAMIRVIETSQFKNGKEEKLKFVEYWTAEGMQLYKLDYNSITLQETPPGHFYKGDKPRAWGRVPFIAFKNNWTETNDLKPVKPLLDAYDLARSETANYINEVKNLIYVLRGYGGEDIREFIEGLNMNRAVSIDDPTGGVDALTPTMDITALSEHCKQLKIDITEDAQSINKDLDKIGNAPSGKALKFMYAGMDLKCNAMETEFRRGFNQLLYFLNFYKGLNVGKVEENKVEINFNRNIEINEAEIIENCIKSKGLVSNSTILTAHPWIQDVELEEQRLEEEREILAKQWREESGGVEV